MTKEITPVTEDLILNKAREVFIKRGFEGARMQEIADLAGINKSLLHYYFRSKDLLFERIFKESFGAFFTVFNTQLQQQKTLDEFIRVIIPAYLNVLNQNPFLPNFIIHEITTNPSRIHNLFKSGGFDPNKAETLVKTAIEKGEIHPIYHGELIMAIVGHCVFPYLARPMFQIVFYKNNPQEYEEFLSTREKKIIQYIFNAFYINPPKA